MKYQFVRYISHGLNQSGKLDLRSPYVIYSADNLKDIRSQVSSYKAMIKRLKKEGNLNGAEYSWINAPSTVKQRDFKRFSMVAVARAIRSSIISEGVIYLYYIKQLKP